MTYGTGGVGGLHPSWSEWRWPAAAPALELGVAVARAKGVDAGVDVERGVSGAVSGEAPTRALDFEFAVVTLTRRRAARDTPSAARSTERLWRAPGIAPPGASRLPAEYERA